VKLLLGNFRDGSQNLGLVLREIKPVYIDKLGGHGTEPDIY
jgi:hypothetical protein